ncbi:MAG: hypothetical protein EG823_00720 [Actinobacteria bacterium]|nr:hypothetical protein [Actinomycetota bacterium]
MDADCSGTPIGAHEAPECSPPFEEWRLLAEANAAAVRDWPQPLRELRERARTETATLARGFTAGLGVSASAAGSDGLIVMTGHQPELYHPGVWAKDFLVQRFAEETGALGIDVVVDTDACDGVVLRVPVVDDSPSVRQVVLIAAQPEAAYAQVALPDAAVRASFREVGAEVVQALHVPALRRHFIAFCDALECAATGAAAPAELMVGARRRYEAPADTDYLEVLASSQARTASFRAFAASVLADAQHFREVTNSALAAFRARTGARSAAQPFPDLGAGDDGIEVPFWLLRGGRRVAASVGDAGVLYAGGERIAELGSTEESAAAALAEHDLALVPRALTLTLFERLFVADLFVHGTGGGRYDEITDGVISAYYGIDPPAYAVATLTMRLPLVSHIVTDADVTQAEERLRLFEHNPDTLLDRLDDEIPGRRAVAEELARQKADAVAAIALPGADKKVLGQFIRKINEELSDALEPARLEVEALLERLRAERDEHAVLADRTYAFCLFDPCEVARRVR